MKKSVTLIELLMCMSLLAFIVLAAMNIEGAMRRFLRSNDHTVQLVNEVSFILDHIHKNALDSFGFRNAAGQYTGVTPGPIAGVNAVTLRVDRNDNPADLGELIVQYRLSGNTIQYREGGAGAWEALTTRARNISFTVVADSSMLDVFIAARWNPTLPEAPLTNPEIQMNSSFLLGHHTGS